MGLIFNISPYYVRGYFISNTPYKIPVTPQLTCPQLFLQFRKLLEYFPSRYALQYLNCLRRRIPRWHFYKYMNVVFHYFHRIYGKFVFLCYPLKNFLKIPFNFAIQYALSILRYPDHVVFNIIYSMLGTSYAHVAFIQENVILAQDAFPRLMANRFHPPSKLRGIQR